jgi:hypothetical protein
MLPSKNFSKTFCKHFKNFFETFRKLFVNAAVQETAMQPKHLLALLSGNRTVGGTCDRCLTIKVVEQGLEKLLVVGHNTFQKHERRTHMRSASDENMTQVPKAKVHKTPSLQ